MELEQFLWDHWSVQGQWVCPVKETAYVPTTIDITGHLSPSDVEPLEEICGDNWNGETAVYAFNSCKKNYHVLFLFNSPILIPYHQQPICLLFVLQVLFQGFRCIKT
jgi:hypothetical protein